VQEIERRGRQHAIDMHVVLDQRQLRKTHFEIAGAITGDSMAKDQILRSRRRADRIDLHESERRDGRCDVGRLRQRARRRIRA